MNYKFTTIPVKDLNESLKFYTEVLKLSQLKRFSPREGVEIAFLADENDNKIELLEDEEIKTTLDDETKSKVTIAYGVDNLDNLMDFLNNKNIKIKRGPIKIPSGRFITIEDPNGVQIGLHEDN